MTRLLVARHGQSTWNADGRWQGRADPPLSELGERQAAAAACHSAVVGITRVWTSPLERAHRTACILAVVHGVEVTLDARLQERDAGEWTGLTRDQIEAGWPGFLADRRRPPAFEADDVVAARALEVLQAAVVPGETILVVSHGGLIRMVERSLGTDAPPVPNLGGRELVGGGGGLVLRERFLLLDDSVEVTTPRQL